MRFSLKAAALVLAVLAMVGGMPAMAQTVGVPSGGGGASLGIDNSAPRVGTTVRALNTRLAQYSLSLRAAPANLTVRPAVYPVTAGVIGAAPIWTGTDLIITSTAFTDYTFTPNLTVTQGNDYALVVEQAVAGQTGEIEWVFADSYADGVPIFYDAGTSAWVENAIPDAVFSAVFAAPAIPTLSEWAMLLFGTVLAGCAALHIQRGRLRA